MRPCAWWAIDTHLDFAWCLEKARGFDLVFAAQRDGAEQLRRAGIGSAAWLPLACDPEIHRKHDVAKQYDVAFVGNVFPGPRAELLNLIRRRYPNSFIGQCYFEEMARTYSAARTVFNRSIRNDVNMRVFEALACGSLLVTNDLSDNGQAELFRDGVHLATYREAEDLLDKLAFYLGREALREKIAAAGRAEALEKHTYRHRMERLLREAEAALTATGRGAHSPTGARRASTNGSEHNAHDPSYFGHARPEVLALIPETARAVLDIGCGAGRLGEAIKARQQAEVVGIELNEAAAAAARLRLDQVFVGDIERLDLPLPPGPFDAIVCGDILEHLREPDRLLRQARAWLAPDGALDRQHPQRPASQRRPLAARGQLDLRVGRAARPDPPAVLHPPRDREALLPRRLCDRGDAVGDRAGAIATRSAICVATVQVGRLSIGGLSDQTRPSFTRTSTWSAPGRPRCPTSALTSIVIVTHNQLEYTRQCLDSIRRLTDEPYELIVVDNGSTDGTVEYLRAFPGVRVIVNETNRGLPGRGQPGDRGGERQPDPAAEQRRRGDDGLAGPVAAGAAQRSRDRAGRAVLELRERPAAGRDPLRQPGRPGRVRLGLGQGPRRRCASTSTAWSGSAC